MAVLFLDGEHHKAPYPPRPLSASCTCCYRAIAALSHSFTSDVTQQSFVLLAPGVDLHPLRLVACQSCFVAPFRAALSPPVAYDRSCTRAPGSFSLHLQPRRFCGLESTMRRRKTHSFLSNYPPAAELIGFNLVARKVEGYATAVCVPEFLSR